MISELAVLLEGREVGLLRRLNNGRTDFSYRAAWQEADDAYPLSLSMPLASSHHLPEVVEPFLWNLLPDNDGVLRRWASRFGVSQRNVFGLIKNVGEELAGAVQIVPRERISSLTSKGRDEIKWLSERDVARRLQAVREDASAGRLPNDSGQFSLAGAQPKTALIERDGKWGLPGGRTPTTHILKPPSVEWKGFAENEHFCLQVAGRLGIPAATSRVMRFEDETAIVVERYDRVAIDGHVVRIHQEDTCQSLGIHPINKYENEGGPGIVEIVNLLKSHSSKPDEDVATFINAQILNWLIGATDGHAKNFSVLIAPGKVRLAPLYDIVSRLAYDPWHPLEYKLAMRVGSEYITGRIGPKHWKRLSMAIGSPPRLVFDQVIAIAESLEHALVQSAKHARQGGLDSGVVDRIVARASQRARDEAKTFRNAITRGYI